MTEGIDGGGAPVGFGRREVARELRGSEAERVEGSAQAERLW